MLIVVSRQCDAEFDGGRKALFPGQRYELPDDVAQGLISSGMARPYRTAESAFTPAPRPAAGRAKKTRPEELA